MQLVLSAHRTLRLANATAMYLAQGIQIGLCVTAFPAYLASLGVSSVAIGGWIGALTLPWTLKLLYAPFMERYTFLPMGRRRPWIIAGTLGGGVGYFAMSMVPDPVAHLGLLTAFMVAGSVFIALQDIATDALAIDLIPVEEQGLANGLMWGGKVLGTAATAGLASWLFEVVGLSGTFALAGWAMVAFALLPLLLRERPGERLLPWTAGTASDEAKALHLGHWSDLGQSLWRSAILPASLLAAFTGFLAQTMVGFLETFGPVFAVQTLGWTHQAYSGTKALAGLGAGLAGMALGGLVIRWLGQVRAVALCALALLVPLLALALMPAVWATSWFFPAFLVGFMAAKTLSTIAFFALCMALCWRSVAGVQFALFMALSNFGIMAGSAVTGVLLDELTTTQVLLVVTTVPVIVALLVSRINLHTHRAQLEALERAPVGAALPT